MSPNIRKQRKQEKSLAGIGLFKVIYQLSIEYTILFQTKKEHRQFKRKREKNLGSLSH